MPVPDEISGAVELDGKGLAGITLSSGGYRIVRALGKQNHAVGTKWDCLGACVRVCVSVYLQKNTEAWAVMLQRVAPMGRI